MTKPYLFDLTAIPEPIRNSLSSREFKIKAEMKDDVAELLVFDRIGRDPWSGTGIGSGDVAAFLSDHRGAPVNVRINSPGGLAFDAITIHNALVQHDAPVSTVVEGLAASAATLIAVAVRGGGKAKMFENSTFMVHRALCLAYGNVDDLAATAEWLNRIDEQIARTYSAKTGKRYDQMLKLMVGTGKFDGTVMTAKEAKEAGFIDEIVPLKGEARNDVDAEKIRQQQMQMAAAEASAREKEAVAVRLRRLELENSQ